MKRTLLWGTVFVLLTILGGMAYWGIGALLKGADQPVTIPPEKVADYVHAVIEANRTVYATNVVDKMQEKGIVEAAEHWRQENALPLPAQFFMDAGRLVAEKPWPTPARSATTDTPTARGGTTSSTTSWEGS